MHKFVLAFSLKDDTSYHLFLLFVLNILIFSSYVIELLILERLWNTDSIDMNFVSVGGITNNLNLGLV